MGAGRLKGQSSSLKINNSNTIFTRCQSPLAKCPDNVKSSPYQDSNISTSSNDSEDSLDFIPTTPDGGWGWVVCFASFMIMVIMDGILFSFGVIFIELVEHFRESKGKTALVGSVCMGVHLIIAPFTSALINVFGCRKIAMTGGLIASLAFGLSALVPNIDMLILTYGVLGGIGVSFIYLPSILVVGFYFDKKRAIANGLANAGSGVGAFVFAPLIGYLCDMFTWSGCMLLTAGIVLHCIALAQLYWPLSSPALLPRRKRHNLSTTDVTDETESLTDMDDSEFSSDEDDIDNKKDLSVLSDLKLPKYLDTAAPSCLPIIQLQSPTTTQLINNDFSTSKSFGNLSLPYNYIHHSSNSFSFNKKPQTTINCYSDVNPYYSSSPIYKLHKPDSMSNLPNTGITSMHQLKQRHQARNEAFLTIDKPLCRKDIFYSGSVYKLSEPTKFQCNDYKSVASVFSADDATSMCAIEGGVDVQRGGVMGIINTMLNVSILTTPHLILYICCGVLWTAHASVLNVLPAHAVCCGHSPNEAAMLLSIIGISNIVGRVLSGLIAGHPQLRAIWINMAALFIGSISVACVTVTTSYITMCLEVAVFGCCMGAWTSLRPIVLVELLGIDNLTSSLGLCGMFQGIAFTIGTPISGMIYDMTNSYQLAFVFASIAFFASGIFCIPMSILIQRQRQLNDDSKYNVDLAIEPMASSPTGKQFSYIGDMDVA